MFRSPRVSSPSPLTTRVAGQVLVPGLSAIGELALAFVFLAAMLFWAPRPAFAASILQFLEDQQAEASQELRSLNGPAYGTDASGGVFVMVSEAAHASDGSDLIVWHALLDENGNAVQTFLGTTYSGGESSTRSDVTFDELGGMVSSLTTHSSISNGETTEEYTDELVIVDERSGRVESYVREDTVALLDYHPSGKISRITYLYSLNELGGIATDYDEQGLPTAVGNINGRDDTGQIAIEPWAQIEWVRGDGGMPVEVRVINVQTGGEIRYPVACDESGNIVALYTPNGSLGFEFTYEFVENPSALVSAMPVEFLADIALVAGVPD